MSVLLTATAASSDGFAEPFWTGFVSANLSVVSSTLSPSKWSVGTSSVGALDADALGVDSSVAPSS